jgi:hypothetical protein
MARKRQRGKRGTGLCAHSGVRGQCSQCDAWAPLHYPAGATAGFCSRCCSVCGNAAHGELSRAGAVVAGLVHTGVR